MRPVIIIIIAVVCSVIAVFGVMMILQIYSMYQFEQEMNDLELKRIEQEQIAAKNKILIDEDKNKIYQITVQGCREKYLLQPDELKYCLKRAEELTYHP